MHLVYVDDVLWLMRNAKRCVDCILLQILLYVLLGHAFSWRQFWGGIESCWLSGDTSPLLVMTGRDALNSSCTRCIGLCAKGAPTVRLGSGANRHTTTQTPQCCSIWSLVDGIWCILRVVGGCWYLDDIWCRTQKTAKWKHGSA